MEWEQVCAEPNLKGLPYKIELNERGQIVMSPASIRHVIFQKRITVLIETLLRQGETFQEFPVKTSENVKVPDAVWISDRLLEQVREKTASPVAPEICVEIMSPGNSEAQMLRKGRLYFEAGAKEFWLCDGNGNMTFHTQGGKTKRSALVPGFPEKIENSGVTHLHNF